MGEDERPRGVLNKRDREYLTGDLNEELSENARRQREFQIRNRIRNAILDFSIIARNLSHKDIEQIFEPSHRWAQQQRQFNRNNQTEDQPEIPEFVYAWLHAFEFFSYGISSSGLPEGEDLLVELIREGLETGNRRYQIENQRIYSEPVVNIELRKGRSRLRKNHLLDIKQELINSPQQNAEQILQRYQRGLIPRKTAQLWIQELVQSSE